MSRSFLPKLALRSSLVALLAAAPLYANAADAPAAAPKDPVVANVNGTQIHETELALAARELGQRAQGVTYQQLLDRQVTMTLLVQAAKGQKLENDPEVKAEMARVQDQIMAQIYLTRVGQKAATDAALKAKYDDMVKGMAGEQEIHARHILLKDEASAKAVIAQLDKGADFGKLATAQSQDKGAAGGDLGWFTKDKMVPEFSDAAFKLKKGEYSKTPVKSSFGYHVIKVEDIRPVTPPKFEDAKADLTNQIGQDAVNAELKSLRDKAKVEEFNPDGTPLKAEAAPAAAAATPAPAAK